MAQPIHETPYKPEMNRRMIKRGIIGVIVALVLLGLVMAVQHFKDIDLPAKADTKGWMAAVLKKGDGAQAVLIKPDGTVVPSPDYTDGATDRELTWRPDGNRLFFISDREKGQVQLYRWNPASNKVERRSQARAAYSHLYFRTADELPLVISNGNVAEFDPTEGISSSIIPPARKSQNQGQDQNKEEGAVGSLEEIYGDLGNGFKEAAWFGNGHKQIIGVLKGATDETLILQDLTLNTNNRLPQPALLAAGDRIDVAVSPKTGVAAFTVQRFRLPASATVPPEFIKNGKVVYPFRHMVGMLDPRDPSRQMTVLANPDDSTSFANPVFAPDGNSLAIVAGVYQGEGDFIPKVLLNVPAREQAATGVSVLVKGPAYDATFSSDGASIAYVERGAGDQRAIHVMSLTGNDDHVLAQGDYSGLRFSPQ